MASIEVPATLGILKDDDIWVCDTAASNHFSKNCDGAYNVRNTSTMSTGMSGASVDATMMDFVMTQYSKTGAEGERFKLTDVNYSKKFNYNLFSAARCLKNGWTMTGDREGITLIHPNGGHKLVFDIVIPTKNGALFATMLKKDIEIANTQVEKPQTMTLLQAHNKLGHCDRENQAHSKATQLETQQWCYGSMPCMVSGQSEAAKRP